MNLPADRSFEAYQQFVLDCKIFWSTRVYPELKSRWEGTGETARPHGAPQPRTAEGAAALFSGDPLYQFYGWYERHLQRMKYSGRLGLVPQHERVREAIEARLSRADSLPCLELDPELRLPEWYTAFDVHQHPGGVWGDTLAGVVYQRGARSTTPLLRRHADLHARLADDLLARTRPKRLLDMGCGFGKSTRPFYLADPAMEIVATDLSAPCLRLAALTAQDDGASAVRFLQADAAKTGLDAETFDAVTSTMLLHEVPPDHLERIFTESYRVLRPGGLAVHLDFLVPEDDPFGRFIHFGHGVRNNEPFMEPLCRMDVAATLLRIGFSRVEILPFEEAPGTLSPEHRSWRFPWALVVAHR